MRSGTAAAAVRGGALDAGFTAHPSALTFGAVADIAAGWDGTLWAVEVKRSLRPKVERGFHSACEDLNPQHKVVVYPGKEIYPLGHGIEAMPLGELCRRLAPG